MHQRGELKNHLIAENLSDRSTMSLDGLAAILWDMDPTLTETIADELALSKDEENHLYSILMNKQNVIALLKSTDCLDNRMIYQYYRSTGSDGVDICLISLADEAKSVSAEINSNSWLLLVDLCKRLIVAWFDHPEVVNPKLILTGRDLMFHFDLNQGPIIGELLNGLKEEQAAGLVSTRVEAMEWIENQLHKPIKQTFSIRSGD